MTRFTVQQGDVASVPSDLLLLKFAQAFYGADRAVARRLVSTKVCTDADLQPAPGKFVLIDTHRAIASSHVMFLGTPPLSLFTYDHMHVFARMAIEHIAGARLPIRTMTTTVHGTGYGLDGGEALQRLVRGFLEGLSKHNIETLETIVFVTLGERAERMLNATLDAMNLHPQTTPPTTPTASPPAKEAAKEGEIATVLARQPDAVTSVQEPDDKTQTRKKRIFVALPFSEEFENVYEYGIYPAVRNSGFICERVDEVHFAGDVLSRIREGIQAADLVIADLTEARPNVYLEVGYAWGRGVPVIFVARKGQQLHFDVSTHRCIFYGKFAQLAKDLEDLIRGIDSARHA